MTLLEVITKATNDQQTQIPQSEYPIILNSDSILCNLKELENEVSEEISIIKRVEGWKISEIDSEIIKIGNDFVKKLKRKLKNPSSFGKDEFFKVLNSFLEKNREKFGGFEKIDSEGLSYTRVMMKKLRYLITPSIGGLILESCLVLEIWDLVETLIVEGFVGRFNSGNLIEVLVKKRRSYLICLCIKHFSDIESSDLQSLLKYFLSPPKGANSTMMNVRKKWEKQALSAIKKATDETLSGENLHLAKNASILLMVAYDEFSSAELCMHYLFASSQLDELNFPYSLSGLDGLEMLKLIRYFGKWLKKYLKFPQAGPCPNASSALGLKMCDLVPSVESIVKYLGLVIDEQFTSLVLYSDFHDELRSLEEDVKSLAEEARSCCSLVDIVESLKEEIERH
ncbi:hypothetical protein ACHQM5_006133 [Ranunculus cassubicifolius]